jgi:hypothetical protein
MRMRSDANWLAGGSSAAAEGYDSEERSVGYIT